MRSRVVSILSPDSALVSSSNGTFGGGAGGGDAEQHFHDPLAAQHRRGAIGHRRQRENAAVAEQAAAVLVRERDAPEIGAVHVLQAVVPRDALVDERVVGA